MTIDETMLQLQRQQQLQESSRIRQGASGATTGTPEEQEKLREACREFEAIFLNIMLKQMRSGVEEGGLVEKSHARGIFEEMHDEELSKAMAQGRGIGLAQQLYQQLTAVTVAPDKKDS